MKILEIPKNSRKHLPIKQNRVLGLPASVSENRIHKRAHRRAHTVDSHMIYI